MSLRVCRVVDCPRLTRTGICDQHQAEARRARGTTTQQGYGWRHQQQRARLIAQMIGTPCPDCGATLTEHDVADHTVPLRHDRNSVADRVHCRTCSNRQGGRASHPPRGGEPPTGGSA